jgi:hypothetical protein
MSRKRLTPEQIIGKLRKAEVALSAIYPRLHRQQILVNIKSYHLGMATPTRAFSSSLLTVLYRLNTLMVLWPLAAIIRKTSCPWSRQLLMAVGRRSCKTGMIKKNEDELN